MLKHAGRWPRLLAAVVCLFLLSGTAEALTKTRIRDVLYNADGSKVAGAVTIEWFAFTAADGSTIAASSLTARIVQGVISVDLTPNENAFPAGTSYRVRYQLDNGHRSAETWVMPQSVSPVTVSGIRVAQPPATGVSISQAQVTGLPMALDRKANVDGGNTFTAPQTLREAGGGSMNPLLSFQKSNGANAIHFKLPNLTASTTYTWPVSDGLPGQYLSTDGSGSLFWSAGGGGGLGAHEGVVYEIFQNAGTSVTQRNIANFSTGLQAFDNAGQTRTEVQPVYGSTAGTITQGNDSRLSDARTPLAHASTHSTAGSDPINPVNIGALKRTTDEMVSNSLTTPTLRIRGLSGQSAGLTEWRDGSNVLAALVSPNGTAFFREMGIAAPVGGPTVTQFFQQDGKNRFAFSVFSDVFRMLRYDSNGAFKDNGWEIFRNGSTLIHTTLLVRDPAIGTASWQLNGSYAEIEKVTAPATPGANKARIFLNASSGELSLRKDNGSIVSLESGGGGGGGGSFSVFQDAEIPTGAVNGINDAFMLQATPNPAGSLTLARNGVVQKPGVDFLLSGATITFETVAVPQSGDQLIAWYRTNASSAGGDLSGTYPSPTVKGLQGRTVASTAPTDGQCLIWSQGTTQWVPGNCALVSNTLQWHFSGTPGAGVKAMTLAAPEGITGATLINARIVANTVGSTATTFNVERCTSGCTGASPVFSNIYGSSVTLAANTRSATGGTPTTATLNAGDQFRVNLVGVGTGASDITVLLTYRYLAAH